MNNIIGHEIITLFEMDRKNPKLDELAVKILSDTNFDFDIHEDGVIYENKVIIEQNKSKWNNEYYKDHIALLNTNFSKERLKHCLELREYFGEKPLKKKKTFLIIFITVSLIILCIVLFFILNSPNNSSNQKTQDVNTTLKDNNTTLKIGN